MGLENVQVIVNPFYVFVNKAMSLPLYQVENVELYKANLLTFRFKAILRQGGFKRQIYFGNIRIPAYVDTHKERDRQSWERVHEVALRAAVEHGDFFNPIILEWKILQSCKTVQKGLEAYHEFLREPVTALREKKI